MPAADERRSRSIPVTATRRLLLALLPWLVALALAALFWWPLLLGGGFVGGDTYPYYFPLKQHYAEGLKANELWLWHPRIGGGVPVLGESQTGVFYPPNLVAYRLLGLNEAYSAIFLVHYVLAYVFTFWLGRALGFGRPSSLLAALIFVYGWFPPRACLEWAIVTGTWLPLAVFASVRWLQTARIRWGWAVTLILLVQLLAGHFHLAFITLVTLAVLGLSLSPPRVEADSRGLGPWGRRAFLPLFFVSGYLLAALQLLPTWELRSVSQRAGADFAREVTYGSIPLDYFAQLVAPFAFYGRGEAPLRAMNARTNQVEAHLYFGLAPLLLAAGLVVTARGAREWWPWLVLVALGVVLASGWPFAWLAYVPGFNFFRGPGRYGLMAQLGVAMLVGHAASRFGWLSAKPRAALFGLVFLVTTVELYWVGRQVQYVAMVWPPMIARIDRSEICRRLTPADRVLAPAGNLLALSPAACVPPYLGMGPAEYYALWTWGDDRNVFLGEVAAEPGVVDLLRGAGVTHLLTEVPLPPGWPAQLIWSGYDPFLHPLLARDELQPLYLYSLTGALGRVYLRDAESGKRAEGTVRLALQHPHRVVIEVDLPRAAQVVLTDLRYPGWTATLDGDPIGSAAGSLDRIVNVPAGKHEIEWTYSPASLWRGVAITLSTLAILLAATNWYRRRR